MPDEIDDPIRFDKLSESIEANEDLKGNQAVQDATAAMGAAAKDDPFDYSDFNPFFDQLDKSIATFSDPNSSDIDIVNSVMKLTASLLTVASKVPVLRTVAGPMALAFRLMGSITGAFKTKPSYYNALHGMLEDAIHELESDQLDQQLAGVLKQIDTLYWEISDILGTTSEVDPGAPANLQFQPDTFISMGEFELGETFRNLEQNLPKRNGATGAYDVANRNNWPNGAETYSLACKVYAFKGILLAQAIPYFLLVDEHSVDPSGRADQVFRYLQQKFLDDALSDLGPYFVRPDLRHAALTNYLYRLDESSFRLMGSLFADLLRQRFWPTGAGQYRFTDDDGKQVVRWSTVYHELVHDVEHVLINDYQSFYPPGASQPSYHDVLAFSHKNVTGESSHFVLWADTDDYRPQPYYRWFLQPVVHQDPVVVSRIFLFEVLPSGEEISRFGLPAAEGNQSLLILGALDTDGHPVADCVWRSDHDKDDLFTDSNYYKLLEGDHPADNYLFVLLGKEG